VHGVQKKTNESGKNNAELCNKYDKLEGKEVRAGNGDEFKDRREKVM